MNNTIYFKPHKSDGYNFEYTLPRKRQTIRDLFGGLNTCVSGEHKYTWTQDDLLYLNAFILELYVVYPMEPVNYTSYEPSVLGTQKLYEFLKGKIDHQDPYHLRLMLAHLLCHQLLYTDTLECVWHVEDEKCALK